MIQKSSLLRTATDQTLYWRQGIYATNRKFESLALEWEEYMEERVDL